MNSEKENFLRTWENEFKTTLKVLKAYPEGRQNFRPHEISRSAREIAKTIAGEEKAVVLGVISGNMDFSVMTSVPEDMKELIEWYERSHKEMVHKYNELSDEDLKKTIDRGSFSPTIDVQLQVYLQALLIFFGKATIFVKAMNKPLPQPFQEWIG